ncbi:flagellar FliJ family protein [Nocardioides sp.]|uniref:flagellar FliJ family protein n=1 Tax=Nocardioides sp. TaxID=35761 RepID=UPI00261D0D1B|nr:flagellar FliJ family protein [Nocardioides sp.]
MSVRVDLDPGLRAVERVRGVEESATLLELQHALSEQSAREARLAQLQAQLRAASSLESEILGAGTPGALLTLRMSLSQLNDSLVIAREEIAEATEVTSAARTRWEGAKTRLSAVEQLLARRAAERRLARERKLAKEADDLAGQTWLRARTAHDSTPHHNAQEGTR